MLNKFVLLLILLSATLFISGCLTGKDGGKDTAPAKSIEIDAIPKTNLPPGFTYMGVHEAPLDIGTSTVNATEGVYRNNAEDMYIQVIKNENPENLISRYKSQYKNVKYNPFQEIYFNGHNATQVTDYTTIDGKQRAHYTIIWPAEKAVIIVGTSVESQNVISLASATGR